MKMMFISLEVNLVLWVVVAGILFTNPTDVGFAKTATITGCGIAAIIQHWAYYNIYKKSK